MNDFKELSRETLAKIRTFGIKSRSVIKYFKRSCGLLEVFLQGHDLEFTAESTEQWFSEFGILKNGTHSQRNQYLSHRRALFLLLDSQNGQLVSSVWTEGLIILTD
jgi:hypothetical protein